MFLLGYNQPQNYVKLDFNLNRYLPIYKTVAKEGVKGEGFNHLPPRSFFRLCNRINN